LFADELIITNQRGAHLAEVVSGVDEHRGDGGDRARAARRHEHVGLVRAVHRAGRQVGCDRAVYLVGWFGTARQTAQQHACTRETETETEEREQSWREGWHA
jgi:hypothetical protein